MASLTQLDVHPAAQSYPMMAESDLAFIIADMRENGYRPQFPIYLLDGMILDGRNRYEAAQIAGVEPTFVDLPSATDPERFVAAANENRRHLKEQWLELRRRERIDRVAARRQAGESIRSIAEEEKISRSQVVRDLEDATVPPTGQLEPKNVKGKDGKTRQRTSPKRKAAAEARAKIAANKPLCERCQRVGAVKDCEGCKEIREAAKGRQPGDDTPAKSKSGKQLYDWHGLEAIAGKFYRAPDAIVKAYPGEKDSAEAKKIGKLLDEVAETFKVWKQRLLKVK